jgi:hypothetical protein
MSLSTPRAEPAHLPALRPHADVAVRVTAPDVPVLPLGPVARTAIAATVIAAPFTGLVLTLVGQAT